MKSKLIIIFFVGVLFPYQEKRYILKRFSFYQKEGYGGRSPSPLYISYSVRAGSSIGRAAEKLVYLGLAQII
jgi:hypothetical protein